MPSKKVSALLIQMELKDMIKQQSGKMFVITWWILSFVIRYWSVVKYYQSDSRSSRELYVEKPWNNSTTILIIPAKMGI